MLNSKEVQHQFQETKPLTIKEGEAAMTRAEQAPVPQEVPVVGHEMVNKLTAENEQLKVNVLNFYT